MAKPRPPENYVIHFSDVFFPSVAKSLTAKLGSIQSNTRRTDCHSSFLLWRFLSFLIM